MRVLAAALAALLLFSSCSVTEPFAEEPWTDPGIDLGTKLEAAGGVRAVVPEPERYYDGREWLERFTEIVESAEDYVLITTFLGSWSEGLDGLYDTICRKAEEGVEIYMLIDGISSYDMTASAENMFPLYYLRDSGVHLIEYNPLTFLNLVNPTTLIVREHRKLVVADGRWCAIGGMNINYISLGASGSDLQRDSMYVFDSPDLAEALVGSFVTIWNATSVEKVSPEDFPISEEATAPADIPAWLFNMGPGTDVSVAGMYSSLISSAGEEIVILPYLAFLDERMYEALKAARDRGVEVKMYIPVDSREYVQGAIFQDYWKLAEAGFDVMLEYPDGVEGLLHQKLCVVDGRWTVIGSSNFNFRSMGLSHELCLVMDSPGFAEKSLSQVDGLAEGMVPLELDDALRLKDEKGNVLYYLFSYYGG